MNRLKCEELARYALAAGSIALVAFSMAAAQSTPTTKPVVKPAPVPAKTTKAAPVPVAAKAAPVPVAAKPAAVKTTAQTPA